MWIHRLQKKNVGKLINIIAVAKKHRAAWLKKEAAHGFSEWVTSALIKGAGAAHRWTTQKQKAPPLPTMFKTEDGKTLWDPKDKTVHLCHMWQEIWEKKHECMIQIQIWSRILKEKCIQEDREQITAEDIMQASKLLRGSIGLSLIHI